MRLKRTVLYHIGQSAPDRFEEGVMYVQVGYHPKEIIKRFRYSHPFTIDLDSFLYFTNTNRLDFVVEHMWRPGQFSFCSSAPEIEVFQYLNDYYGSSTEFKIVNRRTKKRYDLWPPLVESNWVHDLLYGLVEDEGF